MYTCYGPRHRGAGFDRFGKFIQDLVNDSVDAFEHEFSFNRPSANVSQTEDSYKIEIAAPGLTKKDFAIEIQDNFLGL